jgi:hypothetical protein
MAKSYRLQAEENNMYHHCTAPAVRKYWLEKNIFEEKPIDDNMKIL